MQAKTSFGNKFLKGTEVVTVEPDQMPNIVGVYFSASWCGPCVQFTPQLAEFYNELNASEKKIEIIFASRDQDDASMKLYYKKMPWLSFQFDDPKIMDLKNQFGLKSIPTLLVFDKKGNLLTNSGRNDVATEGPAAYDKWVSQIK